MHSVGMLSMRSRERTCSTPYNDCECHASITNYDVIRHRRKGADGLLRRLWTGRASHTQDRQQVHEQIYDNADSFVAATQVQEEFLAKKHSRFLALCVGPCFAGSDNFGQQTTRDAANAALYYFRSPLHVSVSLCNALTFENLDLESSGQVHMSRSSGQGQGHRSKRCRCILLEGGLPSRLKGSLVFFKTVLIFFKQIILKYDVT